MLLAFHLSRCFCFFDNPAPSHLALARMLLILVLLWSVAEAQNAFKVRNAMRSFFFFFFPSHFPQDGCTATQVDECKTKCGTLLMSCTCPNGAVTANCFDPSPTAAPSTPEGPNVAAIAGGAGGGAAALIIIIVAVWFLCCRGDRMNLSYRSEREQTGTVLKMKEDDVL